MHQRNQQCTKMVKWCKICTKTLLYQKLRYNSKRNSHFCGCFSFFIVKDLKDERYRATVRWTVVTASDQAPAGARVKSFCPCQSLMFQGFSPLEHHFFA